MGPIICSWCKKIDDEDEVISYNNSPPWELMDGDGDDDDDNGGYDYAPAA